MKNWFYNNIYRPRGKARLPVAIVMGFFFVLMVLCTILMIVKHRYGVAVFDAFAAIIDFIACVSNAVVYQDWKKTGKDPLDRL